MGSGEYSTVGPVEAVDERKIPVGEKIREPIKMFHKE
jgi:hypothetical protein